MSKTNNFPVKTNIITGFLGAGKTTLIQQLLTQKPENERWAILVNEFGEIGIDGAFFEGRPNNDIYVREVPGGCMCCASGLPMQIALNQLLSYAKPHRLLIEPTGLGHPKEVLESLAQPHYQNVLRLHATLTLIDARKVAIKRYAEHPTFIQQLEIADFIVKTKSDLYEQSDEDNLSHYLNVLSVSHKPVKQSVHGEIELDVLDSKSQWQDNVSHHHHHHQKQDAPLSVPEQLAKQGSINITNKGSGFFSQGWAFTADNCFDYQQLINMLDSIQVVRLKAVFITNEGIFAFNKTEDGLACSELDEASDSRIELIVENEQQALDIKARLNASLFEDYTF